MARLLALVDAGEVQAVIIAKLDQLTRSVKDLCMLGLLFRPRPVSGAERKSNPYSTTNHDCQEHHRIIKSNLRSNGVDEVNTDWVKANWQERALF